MNEPILIVEDDPLQQKMLQTLLRRKLGYGSALAGNGREAIDILSSDTYGSIKMVVLDYEMPVMNGLEALRIIRDRYPHLPVVMLTGHKDIDNMVQIMKLGATDFITKPYEAERVVTTVKNALKISLLSKEVSRLKNEKACEFGFDDLVGHDSGLATVVAAARKVAASHIPTLITGETGTGKELFAKAIHGESAQSGKPFVAINCGAIPSQLVESTLFGHEKGAFTGATEKSLGKFREAEGGTIFLDEVGELPHDAQVKLLRVLQQREVEPVGASHAVPVNVRILAATNRDLKHEVLQGSFREDLFFRLNVLQIELPALRQRKGDIIALAEHFVDQFCVHEGGLPKILSDRAQHALTQYGWPGNVRQLENAVSRAMVLNDNTILDLNDFPDVLHIDSGQPDLSGDVSAKQSEVKESHVIELVSPDGDFKTMREIEAEAIQIALRYFQDNVTQSAKGLNMAKSTFYKKMK